ncbi:hypothetical protein ACT4UT_26415 [Bacillus sp. B-TM1]
MNIKFPSNPTDPLT